MTIRRVRTLTDSDPACYVVRTGVGTFLNGSNGFAGLDVARLFTRNAAQAALRDAYQAMVNYVSLSIVHLPDSPYRKFFYPG